jgi:nucleoside-diphosphate-sugar epimerase
LGAGGVRQGYVHIDDLVRLYVLALEHAPAGAMLHAVTDEIALGDLATAVSRLVGAGGRTEALSLMEMYARGGGGGVSLSVNKRLASEKTRKILDWTPTRYTTSWKTRSTAPTPSRSLKGYFASPHVSVAGLKLFC